MVFRLHVHLVLIAKYRRGALSDRVREFMRPVMERVCHDFGGTLLAFDGEDDHVHLLVEYPPKIALSALVNSLKGVSARMVRKQGFPEVQSKLWGEHLWSPSYCAVSCGGAPLETVKRYVETQRSRPSRQPA